MQPVGVGVGFMTFLTERNAILKPCLKVPTPPSQSQKIPISTGESNDSTANRGGTLDRVRVKKPPNTQWNSGSFKERRLDHISRLAGLPLPVDVDEKPPESR